MTLYTIKDLINFANRLPTKWKESFINHLEDQEEQLKLWSEHPEDLTKDETLHAGIKYLAGRLLKD